MASNTSAQLLQTIGDLLQEAKPVSYKWLAREYALPANYAKQLLFRFAQERGGSVLALYAVSGAPKASDDSSSSGNGDAGAATASQPPHVVRLVPAAQLEACCKQLQQDTLSVHVHRCGGRRGMQCVRRRTSVCVRAKGGQVKDNMHAGPASSPGAVAPAPLALWVVKSSAPRLLPPLHAPSSAARSLQRAASTVHGAGSRRR